MTLVYIPDSIIGSNVYRVLCVWVSSVCGVCASILAIPNHLISYSSQPLVFHTKIEVYAKPLQIFRKKVFL